MNDATGSLAARLPEFRDYLLVLARGQLNNQLAGKIDASDVVQQTLLEAHRDLPNFRGTSDAELAGWLRQILARNLVNVHRDHCRDKRDVRREHRLEEELEKSSMRLEACLPQPGPSPSEHAMRNEQLLLLSSALCALPVAQREAVELRHLHGWSVNDIAVQMRRSPVAVAGLLHRGLTQLRGLLRESN
jgi:RNA polymerase sigma-70 factor (ECF subfamily)